MMPRVESPVPRGQSPEAGSRRKAARGRRPADVTGYFLTALAVIGWLVLVACCTGCALAPKPQRGGGTAISLAGGSAAATTASLGAPENAQTPSLQSVERIIERSWGAAPGAGTVESPAPRVESQNPAPPARLPTLSPRPSTPLSERITERATTQLGTSQDQAGIMRVGRDYVAANLRGVIWALLCGGATWLLWRKEYPAMACACGAGALGSLIYTPWCGPAALAVAASIFFAHRSTLASTLLGKLTS